MASNSTNQNNSYWITILGDVETSGLDQNGKFVIGKQRLPQLRNIRDLLEKLQNSSKIENYVCAFGSFFFYGRIY
jgi:hypothetical protein